MTVIVVAAAVIEEDRGFLITRRQPGVHLAGCWEFPGGKCLEHESLEACLVREVHEELDVTVDVRQELLSTSHEYDDRRIELHFFACAMHGTPRGMQGQEVRWASRIDLRTLTFPPADNDLIDLLAPAPKTPHS